MQLLELEGTSDSIEELNELRSRSAKKSQIRHMLLTYSY